jgi:hypothetical protein
MKQFRFPKGYVLLGLVSIVGILSIVASSSTPTGGGGIVIASVDNSPPELAFGIGQPNGGPDVTVNNGGTRKTARLIRKTGVLNVLATATDQESGIQAVQIFVCPAVEICGAGGTCLPSGSRDCKSMSSITEPVKTPGQQTSPRAILADTIDLTQIIPQGPPVPGTSRRTTLEMFATTRNHLGGMTTTPLIGAAWSEP